LSRDILGYHPSLPCDTLVTSWTLIHPSLKASRDYWTLPYPNKLLVNLIFCSGSHFGPPGPSKCQNLEFLFMVVEASNFQDLLLFALESH
jgi:hypothetical protein